MKNKSKYPEYLFAIPDYNPVETAEDCYFDEERANHIIDFYSQMLCLIEGVPSYPAFELNDWQKAIVGNLFGWYTPEGIRRYRESFIFCPRKNGKTPLVAGIINYVAFCVDETGGQIYSSAGEKDQAALIYRHAWGMIEQNEELKKISKSYKTSKTIEFYDGNVFYKALSADADSKHGQNAHLIVNDELHVHKKRDLIDTLDTSVASRQEPLIIDITTAGHDKETICGERYEYACNVRDGVVQDKTFLPVIYEIKKEDYFRWEDPEVWKYCNPNLGVSVSIDYLEKACCKAKRVPAKENVFRRLHLNQWTQQVTRWLSIDEWNACKHEISFDKNIIWMAGLDLSSTTDLTALCFVGFDSSGVLHWHTYPFMPQDTAHIREQQDGVNYLTWARQEKIELTKGNCIDYKTIEKRIVEYWDVYKPKELCYDRFYANEIIVNLQDEGIECTSMGQGFASMTAPCKKLEALVLEHNIAHDSHPVLRWCVGNVAVKIDESDNYRPIKASGVKRIDPVVAGLMAIGRLISCNFKRKKSKYEDEGAYWL